MRDNRPDRRPLRFVPDVEETTVRRIVGVLVGLAGLLLVLGLVAMLPAIDRLLAALSVPLMAVFVAIATLLVVGSLVVLGPAVRRAVEQALDGPDEVVANAAASAMYLVFFAAVVIGYRGFAPTITPLFEAFDVDGLYHLGFLAAGVVVIGALGRRLYRCRAPVTRLLTAYVTDALGGPGPRHALAEDE